MLSLANTIRTFQSEGLSPSDFFARVDQALAVDQASCERLLAVLNEEHTNFPLPPDVYVEVQRRIESREQSKPNLNADETRVRTKLGERVAAQVAPAGKADERSAADPERIKGVGDTLNGRFVLEECLGFGGMGMVYKALDLRKLEASDRNPYIAIKVLNVQFRGHPKSLIALQREAKKAQMLAHPNIVTVYDFDRDGSMVYLTMEYLSGKPLNQMLRAPDFAGVPFSKALPIISGMSKALAYAHERGFVHCDLKPGNVFLTDSGEVKIIDFGIARVFHKPEEEAEATVFDPGSLGGMTPAYASPEMLEHREADPRDDIFALGCITYELLTGRHPFNRVPATQARSAGLRPQRPKDLGARPWRALQGALALDRESRTPTVSRFLQGISGERRPALSYATAAPAALVVLLLAAAFAYYGNISGDHGQPPALPEAQPASPPAATAQASPPPPLSAATLVPTLAAVPCSALAASIRDDSVRVQGYVSRQFDLARLKALVDAVPGVASTKLDVRQVGDENCGIITALAPYWTRNRESGAATSIRTKQDNAELREGDSLILDITTPGYDAYVSVDYYVLGGGVVHLLPSPRAKDNQAPPNYAATIGSVGSWVVAKPFGSELIVLLATPAPLFDGLRPEQESRADYLPALQKQLAQIAAKYGSERLTADFVQVTTRPKP